MDSYRWKSGTFAYPIKELGERRSLQVWSVRFRIVDLRGPLDEYPLGETTETVNPLPPLDEDETNSDQSTKRLRRDLQISPITTLFKFVFLFLTRGERGSWI